MVGAVIKREKEHLFIALITHFTKGIGKEEIEDLLLQRKTEKMLTRNKSCHPGNLKEVSEVNGSLRKSVITLPVGWLPCSALLLLYNLFCGLALLLNVVIKAFIIRGENIVGGGVGSWDRSHISLVSYEYVLTKKD